MTFIARLEELARLVGAWRSAKCLTPRSPAYGQDEECAGDNHVEGCPVARALDDVIAAHNALGAPGMKGDTNG